MTVAFWPTDLPQRVLVDGYSEGVGDGRLRQAMDAGPPKMRRRSSAATRPVRARLWVDFDGMARLKRFWAEGVAGGSLPFLFPDQTVDGLALLTDDSSQLLTESGAPLIITSWWLVMFGQEGLAFDAQGPALLGASFGLDILP
ncbi:hypothetical protein [Xanthobacter versatilis]|uniref:hypothetical protein n=1 Tax=Xanthobacter autotrophicus (strain ATCC BAA-1158 / Py2) TaxID=78245 RepID=UPI00372B0AFC